MALPKPHRLSSRQDFQAVFQAGIRRSSPHLTLRALRATADIQVLDAPDTRAQLLLREYYAPARLGVSVSTKVSKRAVVRNRIKRQIQAAFRYLLPKLSSEWQLVVVVKPSAAQECDYQQFLQELEQLLAEAEVLNGNS